ncbi:MAG: DUF4861 domain-containing protein [Duncaniella sp.]|nr:DUF4861 domain-containing protein [Duncaniella sp.]
MKHIITISALALAALSASAASLEVKIENPLDASRTAVPVTVNLHEYAPGMNPASAVVTINGEVIPCQIDDLDADSMADELVFVTDVAPRGTVTAQVELSETPSEVVFQPKTYAYIKLRDEKKKYPKVVAVEFPGDADTRTMYNSIYGHGAVMEGLYNAIRVYMDNRQSVDVYGKNTKQLEMDVTGFYTTPEQLAAGYGHDILWAGQSVAAGSFRGYQNGTPVYIDSVASRGQRVVVSGPVRSIVRVDDHGWNYNGTRHDMSQFYTLWADHRDYDVDVFIKGTTPADVYATGVQKMESDNTGFVQPDGLAGCWGSNIPEKKYADLVEWVGLGVSVAPASLSGTAEDEVNYLTFVAPDADGHISYGINIASAREEGGFKDAADWYDHLRQWHAARNNPCKVTVTRK